MGAEGGESGDSGDGEADGASEEVKSVQEEEIIPPFAAFAEKAKLYTSICLGTTAILSIFAFLFLIPFVIDPAITTIMSDYEQRPVTCMAVHHVIAEGLRNCSWSSCREGCTREASRCHQILVNYSKLPFDEFSEHNLTLMQWDVGETHFFINTEGCGYPPRVNCSEFAKKFGYLNLYKPFPCYYSRTYPEIVVARYNWDDNLKHLIISLVMPNVVFAVSVAVLCYWYCPGCNRACSKKPAYVEQFPNKDE